MSNVARVIVIVVIFILASCANEKPETKCSDAGDCLLGEYCLRDICQQVECINDGDCEKQQSCENGNCKFKTIKCTRHADCPDNGLCIEDKCEPRKDTGEFKLVVKSTKVVDDDSLEKFAEAFRPFIDFLNKKYILYKRDVPVYFQDCGIVNAFYRKKDGSVTMCYEFVFEVIKIVIANSQSATQEEIGKRFAYVNIFVLFHEIGHALVGELDLPVTGKEEDAVDQFATYSLLKVEQPVAALLGGLFFKELPTGNLWGEHSLGEQRAANIMCWVFGTDPERYQSVLSAEQVKLLLERRCTSESKKMIDSWDSILSPFIKSE